MSQGTDESEGDIEEESTDVNVNHHGLSGIDEVARMGGQDTVHLIVDGAIPCEYASLDDDHDVSVGSLRSAIEFFDVCGYCLRTQETVEHMTAVQMREGIADTLDINYATGTFQKDQIKQIYRAVVLDEDVGEDADEQGAEDEAEADEGNETGETPEEEDTADGGADATAGVGEWSGSQDSGAIGE